MIFLWLIRNIPKNSGSHPEYSGNYPEWCPHSIPLHFSLKKKCMRQNKCWLMFLLILLVTLLSTLIYRAGQKRELKKRHHWPQMTTWFQLFGADFLGYFIVKSENNSLGCIVAEILFQAVNSFHRVQRSFNSILARI